VGGELRGPGLELRGDEAMTGEMGGIRPPPAVPGPALGCLTFSFTKYSTALTSWLVTRSISLTRRESASEKFASIS